MITAIQTSLNTAEARALNWRMSLDSWAADQEMRGEKVALFRRYAEGDHDATLTEEMREMLRVATVGSMDRFNVNYMNLVIQTPADRLKVDRIEADNDPANEWISALLEQNRFDGMQMDVHEAALRDADTFVMASWDNEARRVKLTHEPAYDGTNGMLVVLAPDNSIECAIKVWAESRESMADTTRINVYYADRVERFIGGGSGSMERMGEPEAYNTVQGEPVGVPVLHFPNRGTSHTGYGLSEIEDAIPPQNALNRTLHSMVATAELTGFPIRYTVGFDPGNGALTPGMILKIAKGGLDKEQAVDLGTMEQGEITPYIQQAEWLTGEIGRITRTPAPELMGADNASGESLKQREIGLLGKVERFQVKAGNRWEDVIRIAARVAAANGQAVPAFETLKTHWKPAEIRNDKEVIENAGVLDAMGYHEEALRQMAPVFDWDEAKIQQLLDEKRAAQTRNFADMAGNGNLPTFELFGANGGVN